MELPKDLVPSMAIICDVFQYPENENWNVQAEEAEQYVDTMKKLKSIWPIIRLLQLVSPSLSDVLRGCVWVEDGEIVGTVITQRRGTSNSWIIGNVGVLPKYRRRGIARNLVESCIELIRSHGGEIVNLDVVNGNLPAYQLYTNLGFEHYSSNLNLYAEFERLPKKPILPPGYIQESQKPRDWQIRFELARRIFPESVKKYEPVTEKALRISPAMQLLIPIVNWASGTRDKNFVLRTAQEDKVVALFGSSIPLRGKGFNRMFCRVDPKHDHLAPYIVTFLIHEILTQLPEHGIEFPVKQWQTETIAAAIDAGFTSRYEYHSMGMML
jgi:ribosomal protein S18 acetylase RimI-like enzyme